MSIQDRYTEDEWFLLVSTPAMIGAAMSTAGESGPFGTAKEAVASLSTVMKASKDYPDSELIQELNKRIEDREAAKAEVTKYRDQAKQKLEGKDAAALREEAVEDARKVSELLSQKAGPEDVQAYRAWAMQVAENVAKAAKEGSFLGFGGEQVNAEEQALLDRINTALNA